MFRLKSFQRRILLALLAVALVPAALLLLGGTLAVREVVTSTGTAGPWGSLAQSGQTLLEEVEAAGLDDPELQAAARAHREALSESLRFSRILTLVSERILDILPILALLLALLVGGLAFWAARQLSRGFSRPIRDLVGWTDLIGRGQPLPPPGPADSRGVKEFMQLRDALRRMARELDENRREAVQAAKLRSWTEMARRVAHELKNPLTPMRMAATTAHRSRDPRTREAGAVLLEEIQRLDEMARTFSQFGRMPEGPPSEIDLPELLLELVNRHEAAGPSIHLEIPEAAPLLRGHYDALLRAFRNLLLNALDAAGPQGRVEIALRVEEEALVTDIRDSGGGIPPEELERIWDPDYTTKSQGTGLGLPMVRQTILAHRGRVEGRNREGGGAVFRVVLPLAERREGEASNDHPTPGSESP